MRDNLSREETARAGFRLPSQEQRAAKSQLLILFTITLAIHAQAGSRASANYSEVTETVDAGGGISTSANYSTIDSAGLISGVSSGGAFPISARDGYIGQLAELLSPEIQVRQPASTNLVDGGVKSFGTVAVNGSGSLIFTIKNTGEGELTGLGILIDGADEEMFTVTAQPTAPVAGPLGSTTFTVQFTPTSAGPKTAALHLANNDADENPFDLALLGNVTAIEVWRQTHFGNIANSGDGADLNDYDHDGLVNLTEFAFGFNPKVGGDGQLPMGQIIGGNFVVYFNQPAGVSGITYGAEWSTGLLPASWTPIPDTGIPPQHAFSVPVGSNKRMFMRYRISNP